MDFPASTDEATCARARCPGKVQDSFNFPCRGEHPSPTACSSVVLIEAHLAINLGLVSCRKQYDFGGPLSKRLFAIMVAAKNSQVDISMIPGIGEFTPAFRHDDGGLLH
jgi:hypothetical protein